MADHKLVVQRVLDQAPLMSPARAVIMKLQSISEGEQKAFTKVLFQDQDILPQSLGEAGLPLCSKSLASGLMLLSL